MKTISKILIVALLLHGAYALSAARVPANVKADLISEVTAIVPGERFHVLLRQNIREGWHTYWINPGDSGAATRLTWELPEGFSAGEIQYPYPERAPYGPLMNFGYHDQALFLVEITVPENIAQSEITLKADAEWLVCADICIPEDAELSLTLPVAAKSITPTFIDEETSTLFEAAREKIPRKIGFESTFRVEAGSLILAIQMGEIQPHRLESVDYFPYVVGVMDNPAEQVLKRTDGGFELRTEVGYDYTPESRFDGVVVIRENAGEMLTTAFEISPSAVPGSDAVGEMSLWLAVIFALIGGIILNLMPCVFPVLSIKILSLMQETQHIRNHGWVYLTGVVFSFVTIAVVLIVLRAGGAEIGWGFQLQSPLIVGLLVYLFYVIGLNLSGFYEISGNLMNMGQSLTRTGGLSGSFFTGVLATVVAAPCTAPFMASAIGYALTQSNAHALVVFVSLGLGMAAPYVLLCYSPALLSHLPKPGPWMVRAKEFLAFPMFGSAIWLVWVLSIQTGATGVLSIGAGAVSLTFAIWLLKHLPARQSPRLIVQLIAIIFVVTAIYLPNVLQPVNAYSYLDSSSNDASGGSDRMNGYVGPSFEDYSDIRLAELRKQGPVFVNFTAAWCITCKVNEAVALNRQVIKEAFDQHNVRYLKGDWTSEDPTITRKLAEYGRSGVPLYLMYASPAGKASVLPQLLTENIVLQSVESL